MMKRPEPDVSGSAPSLYCQSFTLLPSPLALNRGNNVSGTDFEPPSDIDNNWCPND